MEDAGEIEMQCSALASYKREQFDHELRLKRIALSAVNEAARRVIPLPTAEQLKQHTTSHYKAKSHASRKARAAGRDRSRPPPPMLFDSEGTLELAIGLAKETAMNRSVELLAVAESVTASPVKLVVNSHHHLDHIGGNQSFPASTAIVVGDQQKLVRRR
jgi:hypothetical protein